MKFSKINILLEYFGMMSKPVLILSGFVLIAFIGFIDYITGFEIASSIFYLIPISLMAWFIGRSWAFVISALSALVWLWADLMAGHTYSHHFIILWNVIMIFGFFIITAYTLTALKKALEREKELSRTDPLTGVANRRDFYELAFNEIERSKRYNKTFSIAYIDLDNFKQFNDRFGHNEGDRILYVIAQTIKNNVRKSDIVSRLGGDEFAVLLPESGTEESENVVEKILALLQDIMDKNRCSITFSIGVVTFMNPPDSVDAMIKQADELMYSVKGRGKNAIKHKIW